MAEPMYGADGKPAPPYVCTNGRGGPLSPGGIQNAHRRLFLAHPELPRRMLHELRHTFGTLLLKNGVPLPEVQRLMGHASVTITLGYAHVDRASQAAAIAVLDRAIGAE